MIDNGQCNDCKSEPQEAGAPYCDQCSEKRVDQYHDGYRAHKSGMSRPIEQMAAMGWDDRARAMKMQVVIPQSSRCSDIDQHAFSGAISAGDY